MSNGLIRKTRQAEEEEQALLSETKTSYSMEKLASKSGDLKNQAAPTISERTSAGSADVPLSINVFKTFKWQGLPSKQEVLSHAPLMAPLQALNLDPNVPINVRKIWLRSVSTTSKSPIGVQFTNVNGHDLENEHLDGDHFKWSTYTEHPSGGTTTTSFAHLNGGKGLLLHENELDQYQKVNSRVSVKEMWDNVQQHEDYKENGVPTHYLVSTDFSGYTDPANKTQAEKASSMSDVAQLVYANAKAQINNHPEILKHMPDVQLHPLKPADEEGGIFTDVKVRHDNLSEKNKNRFHVIVKADEFNRAMAMYGKEIEKTPKATDASSHLIKVFRPGQTDPAIEPGTTNTIGNIAGQGGVSTADAERAKTTWSSMHLALTYEIDHPGSAAPTD